MKGILLRGLFEVTVYLLTLPIRLIIIIGFICYAACVSIKYGRSFIMVFMEIWKPFFTGMKISFLNEIAWVKTGNCKNFDEVVADMMSEEES